MYISRNCRMPIGIKQRRLSILLSLIVLVVAATASVVVAQQAQPRSETFFPEKQGQIQVAVSQFMASSHAPGVSVSVVESDELTWSSGFGYADLENRVPATAATLYRLGSISKSITATGAMQLWERKKLDLDAPIQNYCPSFPRKEWPITTRELLGHLGGIRHYKQDPKEDLESNNTRHFDDPIAGGIQFFANDPLVAKPGTKYHYSTMGYTLVGCVIEGASGEKYMDYIRENVLAPAGMTVTRPDNRFAIIPNRTRFYSADKSGAIQNSEFLDSSYKIPGGGWLSSADDMARFEIAILTDRLVSRSTRELMWTPLKPSDGGEDNYGLGWGTDRKLGVFEVSHSGGQQGTSTMMLIVPERHLGVIVLVNEDEVHASELARTIMKSLLDGEAGQNKK